MNIIFPMLGNGSRFFKKGITNQYTYYLSLKKKYYILFYMDLENYLKIDLFLWLEKII